MVLLQELIGFFFGDLIGFFLLIFLLFAHQDLLELFRKYVHIAGKQGEKIRVVEINVRVEVSFQIDARHIDIHSKGQISFKDSDSLS